ncbi:MAG: copper chaperone PCu(A)C [Colwellia sp.]|nr:copper chaperone PCu(A)C [Colwellia sp.]MCW8865267.1 copper chaperone PCu(A)C [Colwellia sp.]MCW9082695.1 copper chaperone PCu(A)C [Colwellia sp.]
MKNHHLFLLLLLCSQISFTCFAQAQQGEITVEQAYLRASIPGSNVSSAYMIIANNSEKAVTLLGATSSISPRVEIHQHTMVGGLMRMRKTDAIIIKANERVILQPSGLHLMLFDVKKPLQSQHKVELTLRFSDKKSVSLQVPVYSPKQEKLAQEANGQLSTMQHHHH